MKILHVESGRHLYGGALQALYLTRGLAALGHRNWLACRRGGALDRVADSGAIHCPLPMRGDGDLPLILRLLRLIRQLEPDLVHLHSRGGAEVLGGIAARLAGVPAVYSRRVDHPEARWQVALKYRLYDRVVAISQAIADVLRAGGLSEDRLRVVRSAVDATAYARRCQREEMLARLDLPDNSLLIGIVAQMIERKGHQYLIRALPELIASHPRLRLCCFGQGPLEAPLRAWVAEVGLEQRVRFYGYREDLPELLPCLDLLVHPALAEGLGIALLQAASAGVAVVASAVGGIPEAVKHGRTGLLVPPGDIPALRAAIDDLLSHPGRRRALGAAGQALIDREYSLDAMVRGNLAVYRELIQAD